MAETSNAEKWVAYLSAFDFSATIEPCANGALTVWLPTIPLPPIFFLRLAEVQTQETQAVVRVLGS